VHSQLNSTYIKFVEFGEESFVNADVIPRSPVTGVRHTSVVQLILTNTPGTYITYTHKVIAIVASLALRDAE